MTVPGEVHVVLGVTGPRAAPAPANRSERIHDPSRDHPGPVVRAVAVLLRQRITAHAAADVRVLDRVQVERLPVRVVGPVAGALPAAARRWNGVAALERAGRVGL